MNFAQIFLASVAAVGICIFMYAAWEERQWQRDQERARLRLERAVKVQVREEIDGLDAMLRQLEEIQNLPEVTA